jgi:hypothetical protein
LLLGVASFVLRGEDLTKRAQPLVEMNTARAQPEWRKVDWKEQKLIVPAALSSRNGKMPVFAALSSDARGMSVWFASNSHLRWIHLSATYA